MKGMGTIARETNARSDDAQPLPSPWNICTMNKGMAAPAPERTTWEGHKKENVSDSEKATYSLCCQRGRNIVGERVDNISIGAEVDHDHAKAEWDSCTTWANPVSSSWKHSRRTRPSEDEERNWYERCANHGSNETVLRLCVSAFSRGAFEIVLLELRSDEEGEEKADED